ncbi:MAG: hypothetical protein AAGH15_24125 [Myxococcota bacterium]
MFGFLLGFASLYALSRVDRGRPFHAGPGGCRRARGHHHHRRRRGRRGWRRGLDGFLYGAFHRLDTGPGQEKAIRSAVNDAADALHSLRRELREVREPAADAIRGEVFDGPALDRAFEGQKARLEQAQIAFTDALRTIHENLDDGQKDELVRWLDRGGPARRPNPEDGPYR